MVVVVAVVAGAAVVAAFFFCFELVYFLDEILYFCWGNFLL